MIVTAMKFLISTYMYVRSPVHFYYYLLTHSYFTRLNPRRMNPFWLCFPVFLEIHRNSKQFFFQIHVRDSWGPVLTRNSNSSTLSKFSKMALMNPGMQLKYFMSQMFLRTMSRARVSRDLNQLSCFVKLGCSSEFWFVCQTLVWFLDVWFA